MKKLLAMGLACLVAFAAAGCTPVNETSIDLKVAALAAPTYPEGLGFEDYDGRRAVEDKNPVSEVFHQALNDFAYDTAARMDVESHENMLYSPISMYYALALATMGAEGETEADLLELLKAADQEALAQACGNAYRLLYADHEVAQLKIANSLWMDQEVNGQPVTFKDAYLNRAKDDFYASVFSVDFTNPKTGDLMGDWVSEQTKGTLEYSYDPDPSQIMSIINTIYFYDEWTDRFYEDSTEEDEFTLADGNKVACDFMNSRYGSHGFVDGDGYTRSALGLKEAGRMVFILPDQDLSISDLMSSPEQIRSIFEDGESQMGAVTWQVPKFSYHTSRKWVDALRDLGIDEAFDPMNADFSAMTDTQVFISDILQKTHIAIDEKGVEASAYTEICFAKSCEPTGHAEMILDRPFIYGIQSRYGDLLFIGVCNNPALQ